jgi:hypothetical protein
MVGGVEATCLGRVTLLVIQPVIHGKMRLEIIPCLVQDIVLLPLLASIRVNGCIEDKGIWDVDKLLATVWLISCLGIRSSILHLLK